MQYEILRGDCLVRMQEISDNTFDSIVTDPPYELGFMGKSWDASGIAYNVEMWREALRVLKPGGHLLAFSGSRTYHRMTCAIEDAGFEIRDQIMWVYGSGFPKSLDVSKAIDKAAGAVREETPTVAMQKKGDVGEISKNRRCAVCGKARASGNPCVCPRLEDIPATDAARQWEGWGTALKPAHEPICVARKPLVGTVAANVLEHGTGALNIDGCRIEGGARPLRESDRRSGANGTYGDGLGGSRAVGSTDAGRWPANLIHDGSEEVLAAFPDAKGQQGATAERQQGALYGSVSAGEPGIEPRSDAGSSARFFYCAKASKSDRGPNNTHPTVKPLALMQYLVRLVTPPGGHVLDPFAGSGSTIVAALREGFRVTGIELMDEHIAIIEGRVAYELYGDLL